MNYCSLKDVKAELGNMVTEANNGRLTRMIKTVSAGIDKHCNRSFATVTATRYFDGVSDYLVIDDLLSVTTFKLDLDGDGVYETTLATTDYLLYPYNETPYWRIDLAEASAQSGFATGRRKAVQIAGSWGYASTVPDDVQQACLMMVCRMYRQSMAGYGTEVGTPDIGTATVFQGMPSDAKRLLQPFVRPFYG